MGEVCRVVANEWMKLLRRRRLWVAGVLALFTVGLFALVAWQAKNNARGLNASRQLAVAEQQLAELQADQGKSPHAKDEIQVLQQEIARLRTQIAAAAPGDQWRAELRKQANELRQQMDRIPASERESSPVWNSSQGQLMQIQWQLQHDVRPLPAWQPSPYVQVMNYLSFAARLFLPLIVVIIVADMVAGESTDGTIKLLLVRPVPRWKILMGKWLTSLGASALATAFVIIALWLVGVAVLGNVGASQPVTVGVQYVALPASPLNQFGPPGAGSGTVLVPHYAHAVIIPMWQYLVTGGALTIFAMLAVASVAFLCSTLFRSAMASTGVAMGMTVVGFVLTIMAIRVKWLVWLFFPVHLALFDNWKGVLSEQAQMNVSLGLGMLVLAVWGAAALFVSLWAFSRRDILNA